MTSVRLGSGSAMAEDRIEPAIELAKIACILGDDVFATVLRPSGRLVSGWQAEPESGQVFTSVDPVSRPAGRPFSGEQPFRCTWGDKRNEDGTTETNRPCPDGRQR